MLQIVEALVVLFGEGVTGPVKLRDVALDENIADKRASAILFQELIDGCHEQRTVLSHGPGGTAAIAEHEIVTHNQLRKNFFPKLRLVAVHNRPGQESCIHHFDEVIVLEAARHDLDLDGLKPLIPELLVEGDHTVFVAAAFAQINGFACQIFEGFDFWGGGSRHQNFIHWLAGRDTEIDDLRTLGCNRHAGGDDVATTFKKGGNQFVARHRDDDGVHADVSFLQLVIDVLLEASGQLSNDASAAAVFQMESSRAIDREDANNSAFLHDVQIASEFPGHTPQGFRIALAGLQWGGRDLCGGGN